MDELKLIPGSTPIDTFSLPVDVPLIAALSIDYSQFDECLFSKTMADCELDGTNCRVKLTQEETLLFCDSSKASVQIVVRTHGGDILASEPMYFPTGIRENRSVL